MVEFERCVSEWARRGSAESKRFWEESGVCAAVNTARARLEECIRGVAVACSEERSFHAAVLMLDDVGVEMRRLLHEKGECALLLYPVPFFCVCLRPPLPQGF